MTQLNKIILGAVAIYAFLPFLALYAEEGKAVNTWRVPSVAVYPAESHNCDWHSGILCFNT